MRILRTSSFFKNLVLLSCIIGIFPIMLLGYLSYNKSSTILQEEVASSKRLILKQNKEKVEYLLKTIDTLTTQTISGAVTTNAVSMQTVLDYPFNYEYQDVFNKLIYELVQIQVFELGIQDVHLMSYRRDWIVEGGAVYPMKDRPLIEKHDAYLSNLHSLLKAYRDDSRRSYWKLIQDEKSGYVLKLIKHIPLNAINPDGIITVNVPLQELSKRLTGDAEPGNTLILDDTGAVLASLKTRDIGSSVQAEAYYQQIINSGEQEGFFFYEQQEQKYAVHYNHALYNNWIYVSITPLEHLMSKSDAIKLYTIIFAAILIVLVITSSFIVSHRLYLPINRIYRSIQLDGKQKQNNELKYISEHLVKLAQSSTRLKGQIEQLHNQTREFFVFKLLLGDMKLDSIVEQLEQHDFPANWDQWCVLAIQIDTLEGTQYRDKDIDLMLFAIRNMIEELVPQSMRLSPIIQSQGLVLILGGGLDEDTPFNVQVFNRTEEIRKNVKGYLNLKISIGISRRYTNFIYAPLAHQESLDALTYRVRLGSESILFINEVEPVSEQTFRYPKELEFQIMEAIKQSNHEQTQERLHAIIVYFFENPINHYDYQHFIGRLFNNLTGLVQDAGVSVQEVFEKETFYSEMLVRMHTAEQIEAWLWKQVVRPLLTWMEERQLKQQVNISMLIISDIEQYYDQDLSIEMFAARLHYHPSYISRVFKKDTGVNFSEYLSNYRIEIAKRWLMETDMKISDIAEKLHYSTASNFNRNFKKIVQITPSQYREQFK
ncbi:helix-turn-helix domain-containing protein [Paenibacillus sp. LMG 31456]|uniref:Helix-turn-helix domain-containing protein n=1 Tax=Paenibacillus foliorum TaxID=2654974 RepID=A0A972K0I5_9BACL|nr:helix-turn-helix transcriptional regulator [Paenibacillus foliorum]NOU94701.1 helix-turn-helix domain-containing protein [Paenibacillus foliorum]